MSAWILLILAIACEACWVIGLRFIDGWTRPGPSIFVGVAYILGLLPLSFAAKSIPPSVVYSIWVGGGIVVVALADFLYFGVAATLPKVACISLILIGAVGLKLMS